MLDGTVGQVVKRSLLYTYVLSQPLAVYVDAYPIMDNKELLEAGDMQYGEQGQMVRIVQQKLQTLSYYDDELDGDYGIFTEHSLKKFQKEHDIDVSGNVDDPTKEELIHEEKHVYLNKLKELSGPVSSGMHNEDVKIVQESLKYFGYYEGEVDGIYGPLTERALEIAEDRHDVSLTDEVTEEALEQLYYTEENGALEETSEENDEGEETAKKNDDTEENVDTEENEVDMAEEAASDSSEGEVKEIKTIENTSVVETARSLEGTPYVWGGETTNGFDCSGFIQYVYEEQGVTTPRTVSDIWNFAEEVEQPSVGDLVFFETYKPGPSHMGVYLGNGEFIHASESSGVKVSEMDASYWEERYIGAKRIE